MFNNCMVVFIYINLGQFKINPDEKMHNSNWNPVPFVLSITN